MQATNCTGSSQPQAYTCQTGYASVASASSCNQNLSVQTAPYWQYYVEEAGAYIGVDRSWDPGDKEDGNEFLQNSDCTLTATGTWVQDQRVNMGGQPPKIVDETITERTWTFQCSTTVKPEDGTYVTLQSQGANGVGDNWGSCSQDDQGGCQQNGTVCLDQGGWRTINGYPIYRACWSRAIQYTCTSTVNASGCSPPSGSTETSNTCAARDTSGACTEWNQTWTTPGQ